MCVWRLHFDECAFWTTLGNDDWNCKEAFSEAAEKTVWGLRMAALLVAGYGTFAFIKRDIGNYMVLKHHFVFFDFEEPLIFFLLDYIAVMALFVFVGHYVSMLFKRYTHKRRKQTEIV